jgi:hypothetical protein
LLALLKGIRGMPTVQLLQRSSHQHRYKRTYTLHSATPSATHPQPALLTSDQIERLHKIVATYVPDLHDPAAVEVLLVLLEACRVVDPAAETLATIFSLRLLERLENWGDVAPGRQRPARLQRAWVWLPDQPMPQLLPIAGDGTIWVYPEK